MAEKIVKCRICGNTELIPVLSLGTQSLTGVFPKSRQERITAGPLELIKCSEDGGGCGLLQLAHSYDLSELYGGDYGYRSGLNKSMVMHLQGKAKKITEMVSLKAGDLIIDIGSNDSTLLQAYPEDLTLVGIDPTGRKFKQYYPPHISLIPEFFSASAFGAAFGARKAKVVTSIAMFYDLEAPESFVREVRDVLDDDGIWVFEQSYMPVMLEMNAYDTICHEHLEYYRLKQIKWMTDRAGFKILDVEFNDVNGGSFSVAAAPKGSSYRENTALVEKILAEESAKGLHTLAPYEDFRVRMHAHREDLREFVDGAKSRGETILGYGASTKGNVILQFCGFTEADIPFIAEINKDKFGCFTPGTLIPIIPEDEARAMRPDYFMVLPWHFKENILHREKQYLEAGGRLLFPLPEIEVVGK